MIPQNMPQLDVKNMLIAINGIDSSTLGGLTTVIKDGDVISIIPVIHGGNVKRIRFDIFKTRIELIGIKNDFDDPIKFLENLRQKHIDLIIQGICSSYVLNLELILHKIKKSLIKLLLLDPKASKMRLLDTLQHTLSVRLKSKMRKKLKE